MRARDYEQTLLTDAKLWMAKNGHLTENDAFCDGPATVFSDALGERHFPPGIIERLHQRRCVSIEGAKPRRVARLCS